MIDPDAAMAFFDFVAARHQVWEKRQAGQPQPWTDDPIVASKKFTNVFRVLDYGSQFVLTDLCDPNIDPVDQLMRLFLYRHTGRVEAWEYLPLALGRYPLIDDLDDVLEAWKEYRGAGVKKAKPARRPDQKGRGNGAQSTSFDRPVFTGAQSTSFDRPVFTGAYLVFPQSQVRGTDKLESIVDLTKRLFVSGDTGHDFVMATSPAEQFEALRRNKGVAEFMSMQILTDWGYTAQCGEDRENDFVVAGPGAVRGAAEVNPGAKAVDVIRWARDILWADPNCPTMPNGRKPSMMDVQNQMCEYSKYVRYARKSPSPKPKPYKPAHPVQLPPSLPEHW